MNHNIFVKIRMLKTQDFVSFIKLLIALPIIIIINIFNKKNIWLICESEYEARDNGFWLFKYINEYHKDVDVIYAINYNSPDYKKIKELGKTCKYGTIKHWIYYMTAKYNISTQKGGKPNAAICYVLEVYGLLKNKRVFLQHGITYNDAEWLYYNNTKIRLFICGAKPEYEYISTKFGYPEGYVQYLGFCRFDNLINQPKLNLRRRILVMPTWREWLVLNTEMTSKVSYDGCFENTQYYKQWMSFFNDRNLHKILNDYNIELLFFPHRNMQSYLEKFYVNCENIVLGSWKEYDIQDIMINSDLMITDYSSVFFDFAFMKKPIIFFQFDYEQFRLGQYREGYFDFSNQYFGSVCLEKNQLIKEVSRVVIRNFTITKEEENYINSFFQISDNKNCERIFNAIKNI